MHRTKLNVDKFRWAKAPELAALTIFFAACFPILSTAQQPSQKTFASPEDASNALVTAMQSNDERAILDILGPDGMQITSSGDQTDDTHSRANFIQRYRAMHRLVKESDGSTTLYVGANNWPSPIPLRNKGDSWYFD